MGAAPERRREKFIGTAGDKGESERAAADALRMVQIAPVPFNPKRAKHASRHMNSTLRGWPRSNDFATKFNSQLSRTRHSARSIVRFRRRAG